MFDISWQMGKNFYGSPTDAQGGYGQGNKFVGMLQSDMFSLTDPAASMWGQDYINSANDVYTLRDLSGNPRGETIRYDDTAGSYIDTGGAGGGLLGNMYESAYQPRGLLDWGQYQTDPNFVLQQNNLANYQPWAEGMGDMGALPVYGAGTGTSVYGNNTTSSGAYTPVIDTTTTNTGTGNITTDAQGKTWIMSNGRWIPTTSDLGGILASGNTSRHPLGHYDSNGMWIGAEGTPMGTETRQIGPSDMLSIDLDTGQIGTGTATQGSGGGITFT